MNLVENCSYLKDDIVLDYFFGRFLNQTFYGEWDVSLYQGE